MDTTTDTASISLLERAFEPDKVDDHTETSNGCRYSDVARGSDVSFVVDQANAIPKIRRFHLTPAPTVPDLKRKGDSDRSEPPLLGTHGFRLVQTNLMGNSEYSAEKSCRSTIHHSRTTGTQRTERQRLADAVYRPCCYDHLQKLDKSPSPPVSLVVGILRRTAHPSRRGQPQEKCHCHVDRMPSRLRLRGGRRHTNA